MNPRYRWLIAIIMAIVFLAIGVPIYYIGFFLGGMATDSCSRLPGNLFLYLEVLWPIVMVATAIVPSVLVVRQARWTRVLLGLGIGLAISACCYLSWFLILMFAC